MIDAAMSMTLKEALEFTESKWAEYENCTPDSHKWGGLCHEINGVILAIREAIE